MIVAQVLFITAAMMHLVPDASYRNVQTEQDVIDHHEVSSSSKYRTQSEIAAACIWVSFPMMLIAMNAVNGICREVAKGTKGEILVYVMEKAMLIWVLIIYVILPGITLVRVSYDWSFDEVTENGGTIPTGYYIQMAMTVLEMELIDAACVADATFFVSLFVALRLMLYGSNYNNKKFIRFRQITEPFCCKNSYIVIAEIASCCCALALFIMFMIILFEFGDSGVLNQHFGISHFLLFSVVLIKLYMGLRMISYSGKEKYNKIKLLFDTFVINGNNDRKMSGSSQIGPNQMSTSRRSTMDQDMDQIR